ncbi:MAG: hypothetical protein SGJ18_15305 [Pseudomonadota bacterium]|nr:hypothetical protein [Pseudomonadota bacterium]
MKIKFLSFIAVSISLLLTFSSRQALTCGSDENGPREISFVPGERDGVLNMQISTKKTGLTSIIEDESGFLGTYYMVDFLSKQIRPNEKEEVLPSKYRDEFDFLLERIGKLRLVVSEIPETDGRKVILESIDHLNNVSKGPDSVNQEQMDKAWKKVVLTLYENKTEITTKTKKQISDSFGESYKLGVENYFSVHRSRSCGSSVLNISKRKGDAGSEDTPQKSSQ